jgi:redox-sensitive bicupin YhaK (pirin superfamily)
MTQSTVIEAAPLGFPWATADPFLFCVHHDDAYPAGNQQLGPDAPLHGRTIGMDFEGIDGWRMYHGDVVPGFPRHPHRGFETITIARQGLIDHSDSLGAAGRFGRGDVQWMTAGRGIVHAEMFPLVHRDAANPTELFQIWLNLPRASKMVDPHYTMLWAEDIPRHTVRDTSGRASTVTLVAGALPEMPKPPSPPPDSWASRPEAAVGVWSLVMEPQATWSLPPAAAGVNRTLYFFRGDELHLGDEPIPGARVVRARADAEIPITNGPTEGEILVLQGRAIGEPVVQHGPFVMNSRREIAQAFEDYQNTGFGGWPWDSDAPVRPRATGRFARHADGRTEER